MNDNDDREWCNYKMHAVFSFVHLQKILQRPLLIEPTVFKFLTGELGFESLTMLFTVSGADLKKAAVETPVVSFHISVISVKMVTFQILNRQKGHSEELFQNLDMYQASYKRNKISK